MDHQEIEHKEKTENRRHRRLEWETEVTIRSANEYLPGRTLDISESGMSALLPTELEVGEIVELNIKTPIALATGRAVVRNRNVFRHGFEFLQPLHDVLRQEAADDDCQGCGGTGFNVQPVDGRQGVAFMRTRCPNCDGTGKETETHGLTLFRCASPIQGVPGWVLVTPKECFPIEMASVTVEH